MVGQHLKKMFENSGLRPADVSRKTGIPTSRISEIITGKTKNPGVDTLFGIVEALEGDMHFAMTGEGEMFRHGGQEGATGYDSTTLNLVVTAAEEYLQGEGLNMPPAKKAELIVTLYEMFSEEEKQVDKKTVEKLIRLAV